jgi:hypothetical protein
MPILYRAISEWTKPPREMARLARPLFFWREKNPWRRAYVSQRDQVGCEYGLTCPAKAYQVEVEDSACVVGLWPEIPAVFALHRLK